MSKLANKALLLAGAMASVGAVLHVAIIFGGPDWYAFFGAPPGLVDMARAGNPRAPITCLVIASFLAVLAAYAFSGAGLIRRLPLLRPALAVIATVLVLRGLVFVPLVVWRPSALAGICDCRTLDAFIVITSLICLVMGIGYAIGALVSATGSPERRLRK